MEIIEQVIGLETAKKLKKAGCKQESYFVWYPSQQSYFLWCPGDKKGHEIVIRENIQYFATIADEEDIYPAYGVGELGKMLPCGFVIPRLYVDKLAKELVEHSTYILITYNGTWRIEYKINDDIVIARTQQINEAEARGLMLLYLLEQGFIEKEGEL